jgi:Chalcone isomerase-like
MASRLFAFLFCLSMAGAHAAEIAGVKIEDKTRVASAELALNGAGLRKRAFFQVYAIALYVPQKAASAQALLEQQGPKRVAIHMLRDVGAEAFSEALAEGIRANHTEAEMKALEPRVKELTAIIAEVGQAKKGMAFALDWQPQAGTLMLVNGAARGRPIAGDDFYRALLKIWIGDKPVQDDLKKALLGS